MYTRPEDPRFTCEQMRVKNLYRGRSKRVIVRSNGDDLVLWNRSRSQVRIVTGPKKTKKGSQDLKRVEVF